MTLPFARTKNSSYNEDQQRRTNPMQNKDMAIIGLGAVTISLALQIRELKKRRKLDDTEAQAVIDKLFKNIVKDFKK
jgi:hypothetical protein